MSEVHKYVGFAVVGLFSIGWLWGLLTWALRRADPGRGFWGWLVVVQVVAGLQAVIGIVLLLVGRRPPTWLHLVYGFGPLVVLLIGHLMARDLQHARPGERPMQPWKVFSLAAFVCFGLTLRGLMTGLGTG